MSSVHQFINVSEIVARSEVGAAVLQNGARCRESSSRAASCSVLSKISCSPAGISVTALCVVRESRLPYTSLSLPPPQPPFHFALPALPSAASQMC